MLIRKDVYKMAVPVFIGYILCIILHFGITGLWIAMYFDWITRGIIYYWRLNSGKWLEKKLILK